MTENRRYYYLKVKENFYDSEAMKILENMQDGMIFSNLLMKMYLMSLKNNGILMLTDRNRTRRRPLRPVPVIRQERWNAPYRYLWSWVLWKC